MRGTEAETALVGRDAEMARLRDALSSAGGLVLVSGEEGIGKTRLVREAAALAEAEGRPVVWGRPEQVSHPGPFALVVDLVENLVGRAGDGGAAAEGRALVGELVQPAGGDGAAREVAHERRIAARLRGLLAALRSRPVAVFEDLHAADRASHAVVLHLARSAQDDGHLLLGTYRPEVAPASESLERLLGLVARERLATEIGVPPLDPEASAALAASVLGEPSASDVERIVALGEGIPFFIEELAAARRNAPDAAAIPDTVARAVLARLRDLDPTARRVATAASLVRGSIDADVLAGALGLDAGAVAGPLAAAVRTGLVEDREGRLVFRHQLVRQALAGGFVSVEAQELHRRIAAATERVHAGRLDLHAEALAYHWYEGRDRERAKGYALRAAERALALGAPPDAREAYQLALACSEDRAVPEALVGLAEVGIREGRSEDVEESLRRAADLLLAGGRTAEAAHALGRLAWVRDATHSDADPIEAMDEALRVVPRERDAGEHARLLAQKGEMLVQRRRLDEGERLLQEAAEVAGGVGDRVVRAECLDSLAWAADHRYRVPEALAWGEEACREALLSGEAEMIGRTHNNLATILIAHGRCEDALRYLGAARERLRETFGSGGVAIIDLTEAIARWRMGQPGEVERLVARREVVWARWLGYLRILQAWSAFHTGDRERARAAVRRCWAEVGEDRRDAAAEPGGIDARSAEAVVCELLVALEEPDPSVLRRAETLLAFHRDGYPDDHLLAAALLARATALAGDPGLAAGAVEELRRELERYESPYFAGMMLEASGVLEPDDQAAAARFRGAASALAECSNVVDRARCLRLLGAALAGESREEAVGVLREARELAIAAGSHLEVARSEAALRSLGVRPRAGRPRKGQGPAGALSSREEEVAALVAAGAPNAEIAGRLFLSERTVQDHIAHALRKLGLAGRAALAAWAAKQGLV